MAEFVYQMYKARKAHGDKVILDDVTLSVLPRREDRRGGPERHGQVHAAQDHGRPRGGQQRRGAPDPRLHGGHPAAGAAAGRGQDRPARTSRWRSADAEGQDRPLQRDRRRRWPSPTPTSTRSWRRWASCRTTSTRPTAGTSTRQLVPGHGRAAVPRPRHAGERALRRRASSRGAVPSAARGPRPAAARRAHQPPGRRIRAVAGDSSCTSTPAPCIAVTHDRYFLDNVAEWICEVDRGQPVPVQGQLLHLPGDQGRASGRSRSSQGRQARQAPGERARVGAQLPEGPSGQEQGPSGALRPDGSRGTRQSKKLDFTEIQIPAGPRLGSDGAGGRAPAQGRSATVCSSTTCPSTLPRNGIVGVIGPNGVGKSTLFKTIVGLEPLDLRRA